MSLKVHQTRTEPAARCVACGGDRREVWLPESHDYITHEVFSVHRCLRCGLAHTQPVPASMDRFYPHRYRQYGGWTLKALRALYTHRVRGWLRHLPPRGRVLEVGCGAGWMLSALREHGWRVIGSERSTVGAHAALDANQIPTFVGDLDAVAPESCDLVILFQVLEHLTDPLDALQKSAQVLRRGGTMVVAVPNAASWQARAFGQNWFHLDVPRHLQHFSPKALAQLFQQVGLRETRRRFASPEHDPYGVLQSLLNQLGFAQNLMTRIVMGMRAESPAIARLGMWCAAAVLLPLSVMISLLGWAAGSGAIIEVWAVKS